MHDDRSFQSADISTFFIACSGGQNMSYNEAIIGGFNI